MKHYAVLAVNMSRLARVAIAIAIVLAGQWLAGQPNLYMPIFDAIREEVIMTNDAEIVEMQDDERWLVVIVEFPDALADSNTVDRANSMLMGANSAATYFSEISSGRSTLTQMCNQPSIPHSFRSGVWSRFWCGSRCRG